MAGRICRDGADSESEAGGLRSRQRSSPEADQGGGRGDEGREARPRGTGRYMRSWQLKVELPVPVQNLKLGPPLARWAR